MPYLIAAVLASVAVSILLKIARQRGIGIAQAVALNYPVAALLAWLLLEPDLSQWHKTLLPDAWLFALLGVLFPTVFVVMGRAVEQAGIAKSDAAQRLSLFLPVLAAFALFGEPLAANRAAGLVLAFAALACLLAKPSGQPFSGSLKNHARHLFRRITASARPKPPFRCRTFPRARAYRQTPCGLCRHLLPTHRL